MKNSNSKPKKNKLALLEANPITYVLIHIVWSFIFIEVICAVTLGTVFEMVGLNIYWGPIIGGFIYLACHAKRYKPEYTGNFKGGNTAIGFKLAPFMCIYWVYILIQLFVWGEYATPTIDQISIALMAGICEETIFRVVPVSCLMRQWRDEKKVPLVVALSAIIFGLIHATNIADGASIPITIVQVFGAGFMGVLFCAVYLRSGNILPVILMHSLTDLICFLDSTQTNQNGIMIAKLSYINIMDIAVTAILAVIGIYLIRPSKRAEIIAVWNKKFSGNEISNS